MPRAATGTVQFRGKPPRWWARVTQLMPDGTTGRPWIDLQIDDPNAEQAARAKALRLSKRAPRKSRTGRTGVIAVTLADRVRAAIRGRDRKDAVEALAEVAAELMRSPCGRCGGMCDEAFDDDGNHTGWICEAGTEA